jgi:hypothetical protein
MDTFNFLSVLFSVIMGLAVTEVLQGLRRLILARQRVILYAPALIWAVLMILVVAQAWWGMFGMRSFPSWDMAMYIAVVVQITFIYLAAGTVTPDVPEHGPVDMRAAYYANSRWFFGLLAAVIAMTFVKDKVTTGHLSLNWNTGFLGVYFAFSAAAAITKNRWYHTILAPVAALVIILYAAYLSFRI